MYRNVDTQLSNGEREFILQALNEGLRLDGRSLNDYRPLKFQIGVDDCSATVLLGKTRVCAVISASIEPPHTSRQNEGQLRFSVEFSPMGSPAWSSGRPSERAIEISNIVERTFRETRAVDMEALCIVAGKHAWNLNVDIHVLDHCGNLVDAACLATMAALMAYRKPEVTVQDEEVIIHPPEEREFQPLTIHHHPLAVTFAFIIPNEINNNDCLVVVDPSLQEEAVLQGTITIAANVHGEVCQVQKSSGPGIGFHSLIQCVRFACHICEMLLEKLKEALKVHAVARVQARVRRHEGLLIPPELEDYEEEEEEGAERVCKGEFEGEQEVKEDGGVDDMQIKEQDKVDRLMEDVRQEEGQQQQHYQPLMSQAKRQRQAQTSQEEKKQQEIDVGHDNDDENYNDDGNILDNEVQIEEMDQTRLVPLRQQKQKHQRPSKKKRRSEGDKQGGVIDVAEEMKNEYMAISQMIADSAGSSGQNASLEDAFKKTGNLGSRARLQKIKQKMRQK